MKKFDARAACNAQIRKKRNGCHRYLRVKIFTILYVPWQKEAEIWILNREKWGILVNISGPSPRPTLQFITNPAVNSENKSSIEVCSQTSFQFDSDISRWKTSSTGFYYRKLRKHTSSPEPVFSMQQDLLTWDAYLYTLLFTWTSGWAIVYPKREHSPGVQYSSTTHFRTYAVPENPGTVCRGEWFSRSFREQILGA